LAQWLQDRDEVAWVNYPGIEGSTYHTLATSYLPKGQSGIVTFGVKGGYESAKKIADATKLFSLLVGAIFILFLVKSYLSRDFFIALAKVFIIVPAIFFLNISNFISLFVGIPLLFILMICYLYLFRFLTQKEILVAREIISNLINKIR